MEKTPHDDDEEAVAFHSAAIREATRLHNENDQLRTLLLEVLRAMKEVELTLQGALDKDRR